MDRADVEPSSAAATSRPGRTSPRTVRTHGHHRHPPRHAAADDVAVPHRRDLRPRPHRRLPELPRSSTAVAQHVSNGSSFATQSPARPTRRDCGGLFLLLGAEPRSRMAPDRCHADARGFVLTGGDVPQEAWTDGLPPKASPLRLPGVFAVGDTRAASMKRCRSRQRRRIVERYARPRSPRSRATRQRQTRRCRASTRSR